MRLKNRLRALAAVFAFLFVGIVGANVAEATTGGVVYNMSTEMEYISVTNRVPPCWTCSGTIQDVTWGGRRTPVGFNAQGFYIGPSCNLYSQWGGLYVGGKWHFMSANNITLKLTAKCAY